MIEKADVLHALSKIYNKAYISLPHLMQLEADDLCIEELRALPETFCRKHSVIPISKTDGKVTLVMSDPHNNLVIKEAEQFLGMTIRIMVATESSIHDCLDKVFASSR